VDTILAKDALLKGNMIPTQDTFALLKQTASKEARSTLFCSLMKGIKLVFQFYLHLALTWLKTFLWIICIFVALV